MRLSVGDSKLVTGPSSEVVLGNNASTTENSDCNIAISAPKTDPQVDFAKKKRNEEKRPSKENRRFFFFIVLLLFSDLRSRSDGKLMAHDDTSFIIVAAPVTECLRDFR